MLLSLLRISACGKCVFSWKYLDFNLLLVNFRYISFLMGTIPKFKSATFMKM